MQVNFPNTARAIKFLLINDSNVANKLIEILSTHASEEDDVVINTLAGEIVSMEFTSTHEVEEHIETDDIEICIHTVKGTTTSTATVSSKSTTSTESKTMNTEQNTAFASSTQQAAAQQTAPAAPAADNNELALKIGKGVLYAAGAGAAIAAGVWAWKKWGSSPTSTTV